MTNQHPITPPSELVRGWILESDISGEDMCEGIAIRAAQWGADQELEACAEWVSSMFHGYKTWSDELRAARRPKPPSLKEQALVALNKGCFPSDDEIATIRRALEALPE